MQTQDVTDQRFGTRRVLRSTSERKWGKPLWVVRCDCGRESKTTINAIKKRPTCIHCFREKRALGIGVFGYDLTGQRFSKIVVLRRDGHIRKMRSWLCRCDCGKEFRTTTISLNGNWCPKKSCDVCSSHARRPGEAAFNRLYSGYVESAKDRNLTFYTADRRKPLGL